MKIRDKVVYVYDIEVFPNVFHCTVKNSETKEYSFFEISERKNDLQGIVDLFWTIKDIDQKGIQNKNHIFNTDKIFCGYNNIHYDNPIINYIIDYHKTLLNKEYWKVCKSIFNLSNTIIRSDNTQFSKYTAYFHLLHLENWVLSDLIIVLLRLDNTQFSKWSKWKYAVYFETLDLLTMLFSQKLRVGLKEMQVTMRFHNVQEYEGDFQSWLPISEIDKMVA